MKKNLLHSAQYLDYVLYWCFVALVIVGVITFALLPPRVNIFTLGGIISACFFLRPLLFIRTP
ncbi:MAG: hypothetical protein K2W82_19285 [Candidatus Obscuribacterales bacterium]|nr:hypothetical protein [Candidatus Obscuribacterales bacterium]